MNAPRAHKSLSTMSIEVDNNCDQDAFLCIYETLYEAHPNRFFPYAGIIFREHLGVLSKGAHMSHATPDYDFCVCAFAEKEGIREGSMTINELTLMKCMCWRSLFPKHDKPYKACPLSIVRSQNRESYTFSNVSSS